MDDREASGLQETNEVRRFADIFSLHLDAAYDLACWLARAHKLLVTPLRQADQES